MNATISVTKEVSTLINILTVEPENQPKLIELLRENTENVVSTLDGWIENRLAGAYRCYLPPLPRRWSVQSP
jgi:hypothetical protein